MNWTKFVFYTLVVIVVLVALVFYRWIISYLIAAVLISYILQPLVSFLESRRIPRWCSVIAIYLLVAGALAWFSILFIPELISQGNNLYALVKMEGGISAHTLLQIPFVDSFFDTVKRLDTNVPGLGLSKQLLSLLDSATNFLVTLPKILIDNYNAIIGAVSFIFTVPLISFFLLKDWYKIRETLFTVFPNRYFELTVILLNKIDEVVGNYLRAMLLELIAVAAMSSMALSIIRVPYPVLIGISAGVANIIPYFGPLFGGALAVLSVAFTGGSFINMVHAALAMYIVQLIDNNIVYPVVMGKSIQMHPLWVLLTVLAGGRYGGILWMLISVPLVFIVYQLTRALYTNLKSFRII